MSAKIDMKYQFVVLGVLTIIGMLLEMLGIGMIIPVIAMLANDSTKSLNIINSLNSYVDFEIVRIYSIQFAISIFFLIYLLKSIFLIILSWYQSIIIFSSKELLTLKLLKIILSKDYIYFKNNNVANLINTIINESNLYINNYLMPSIYLATETVFMIGIFSIAMIFEPWGTMIMFLIITIAGFLYILLIKNKLYHWGDIQTRLYDLRVLSLNNIFGSMKEVVINNKFSYFYKKYEKIESHNTDVSIKYHTSLQIPKNFFECAAIFGVGVEIIVLKYLNVSNSQILIQLGLFVAIIFRLLPSANKIVNAYQSIKYSKKIRQKIKVYLDDYKNIPIINPINHPFLDADNIHLSNIQYSYDGKNFQLKNIHLDLVKGESIGIIGKSGAGKSTLIDILLGLLIPTSGHFLVDGISPHTNIDGWHSKIGLVSQNGYLIDGSLLENIAFGIPVEQIDYIWLEQCIKVAQLEEFISGLEGGLGSHVGENGSKLSGGQRQRLMIARALYKKPSILILDEATSALDSETEELIVEFLGGIKGRITTITVAHKRSTLIYSDRVYELNEGMLSLV